MIKVRIVDRAFIVYKTTARILLIIPLQTPLISATCRVYLAFNDLLDQLFIWFVYVYDSPLYFQQS
jgi:hypothetical protein